MKTEHLLLMEQEEYIPTEWWMYIDKNTTGPKDQKDITHGTRSKPHGNISNSSGREDHPMG